MAKDGFEINPIVYSANSDQGRLNAFKEGEEPVAEVSPEPAEPAQEQAEES